MARGQRRYSRIRTLSKKSGAQGNWFDVNEAIEEVIGFTQGELRRARVALRNDLAAISARVMGDRVQLQQSC